MDYKNYYEIIAKENGFEYSDERSEVLVFGMDYGNKVRTEFCTLTKEDIIYFSYDMFAPRAYMNNTYSGVYTVLNDEAEFVVLKKVNPVLNFLLTGIGQKTGVKFVDEHVDIKSKNIESVKKHLTEEVVREYLKAWEEISPIKIVAGKGDDLLPSLPQFKGVTVVGIQTNVWIEPQKLLQTIHLLGELVRKLR